MFSKLPEPEFDEGTKTHPSFAPQRLLLTREREPFPSLCASAPPEASTIFLPLFILDKMNEIRFFITLFQRMLKAIMTVQ